MTRTGMLLSRDDPSRPSVDLGAWPASDDRQVHRERLREDYHLSDDPFFRCGVILVIKKTATQARAGCPKPGTHEPEQFEYGDWYSLEAVRPVRVLLGDDLRDFLEVWGW